MNISYRLKPRDERRTSEFRPDAVLPFGQLRTDHMFLMDFDGESWVDPRIVPYGSMSIMPGAVVLHYAQEVFEGAKAFYHEDGEIYTFRLDKNCERLNTSCEILCMPSIPVDTQLKAIHALIDVDRLWAPQQEGASLYIRPFMFGTTDTLGVKPSKQYTFCVFISPSGPYYSKGFKEPIKLLITGKFHRAAPGGTGAAKAGGNYAASMRAGKFAGTKGASQVLYLDNNNQFIEEAGAMNHFHVLDNGEIIIPPFSDTVLASITSRSVLELSASLGHTSRQEAVDIEQFVDDVKEKRIVEAGGFGTAAVVTSVGEYLFDDGTSLKVGDGKVGEVTWKLYNALTGIQYGKIPAPEGWLKKVDRLA